MNLETFDILIECFLFRKINQYSYGILMRNKKPFSCEKSHIIALIID